MRFAASVLVAFALLAGVAQADEIVIKGFNFGKIELGQTVSGAITAQSKADQPIPWNGATFSALNSNSGWFDLVGTNQCGSAIPLEGCAFQLEFRPGSTGRFEARFCFGLFDPSLDGCTIVRGQVR